MTITGYSPPINYLNENVNSIENDTLRDPEYVFSHYKYEIVKIHLGKKDFEYQLKQYEKTKNATTSKVILIDKIRATLSEISPREWKKANLQYREE